jgi:hypothetical protein
MGQPMDIVASGASNFMTGTKIIMDGGLMA